MKLKPPNQVLLETFGFGSFLLFAFFALCALLLACWIPETKNLPLEEIELLGRDTWSSFLFILAVLGMMTHDDPTRNKYFGYILWIYTLDIYFGYTLNQKSEEI
jgi:L-asparagine transporter-like permease